MADLAVGLLVGLVLVVAAGAGWWAYRVYGWRGVLAVAVGAVGLVAAVLGLRRRTRIFVPPPPPVATTETVKRTAGDILAEKAEAERKRVDADLAGPDPEGDLAARGRARRDR